MRLLRILLLLSFFSACRAPRSETTPLLFVNGRIWTDARAEKPVEALLVEDGRVRASGSSAELVAMLDGPARHVDLAGRTVVPGLQDAHGHIENLGELLETLDLSECSTYQELIDMVAEKARSLSPGEWIVGRGWDQTRWPGGDFPHHAALSAVSADHPVYLSRVDGHAALANAHALRLAGLEAGRIPEVQGGVVHVDASGEPTGVLIDEAMGLVESHRPTPSLEARKRMLLAAQEELLKAGIVTVHDMGLGAETIQALYELEDQGQWSLRVIGYIWANEGLP